MRGSSTSAWLPALLIWCYDLPSLVSALRCFKSEYLPELQSWRKPLLPLVPKIKLAYTEHYVERFMTEFISGMGTVKCNPPPT